MTSALQRLPASTPRMCSEIEAQPLDRVVDADGQRAVDLDEAVALDLHGHAGADGQALRALGALVQPVAQRAGDDREHDVVDRAAEGVAHGAEVVEAAIRAQPGGGAGRRGR